MIFVNFDETPLKFDMAADYSITRKGEKEISIISNQQSKLRVSLCLGITSTGKFLTPMFVFIYKYKDKEGNTPEYPREYKSWNGQTTNFIAKFNNSGFNNED